jgi:hypothetical protein
VYNARQRYSSIYRYKRDGGEDGFAHPEFSSGLCSWAQAPAPAQIGKRLAEAVFKREVPLGPRGTSPVGEQRDALGGTGRYGVPNRGLPRDHLSLSGASDRRSCSAQSFGPPSYVVLPSVKLYKPIWDYDGKTRTLSAHLTFGLGTAPHFDFSPRQQREPG